MVRTMNDLKSASTYVQISREDLEDWIKTLPTNTPKNWFRAPNKAGIYLIPLSETVAVKLSSTIGTSDDAMGRGMASMQLSLVSLVTGQTLNKKAQGQGHFKRTINWRKTWKEGFDRMKDAYMKAQGFYDTLAGIKDRDEYARDLFNRISAIPNWQNDSLLADFHSRVQQGGILTEKQVALIERAEKQAKPTPPPPKEEAHVPLEDPMIEVLRNLYREARRAGDQWLMDFSKSLADQIKAGRDLTPKQEEVLKKNRSRYRVASAFMRKALADAPSGK